MKNLRNRVSYSMVFDNASQMSYLSDGTLLGANSATYYSYDIHGNVDSLLQDYGNGNIVANKMNTPLGNRFKRIAYNYDLISGKVNLVAYQPGRQDQFYHHYEYDAENRLTTVTTSKDSIYWERDASYAYYRHGPLARTELGQNQVQGLDYAYTIQGWLKTVNGNGTGQYGEQDMGEDGFYKPNNYNTNGGENQNVARDAFHYMLNYFDGDYTPVNSPTYSLNVFAGMPSSLPSSSTGADLFNGNIKSMLVGIPALSNQTPYLYGYRYDQLNRLVAMDAFTVTETASSNYLFDLQRNLSFTATSDYRERISYDPNGNIRTYWRNGLAGTGTDTLMDKLTYRYEKNSAGYMISNRLRYVQDSVADGNYPNDLNSQTSLTATQVLADNNPSASGDNYHYDAIGNLIKDVKENIGNIEWTVYGKIKTISKTDGTVISYTYDASGNRISKTVTIGASITGTYYVRDASGNTMSVYTSGNGAVNSGHLTQSEIHLYGSSRLGVYNTQLDVEGNNSSPTIIFTRGNKFFELSNHLGNVLVTISDKKTGIDQNNDGHYDYYQPEVITANDYYSFGMQMPGRSYTKANGGYRYGFNGKENENDVKGEGNQQDYGMRIYDPRAGRFLSLDPLQAKYPWFTPYQFTGNSPIANIDLDGLENTNYNLVHAKNSDGQPVLHIVVDSKTEVGFLGSLYNANMGISGEGGEVNSLYYKGELLAQFSSFQDLKIVTHGKTVEEIRQIGLDNTEAGVNRVLALHYLAESLRQPANPVNYGRNPIQNQQLLDEASSEFSELPLSTGRVSTPTKTANKQIEAIHNGGSEATESNASAKNTSTLQQRKTASFTSEAMVGNKLKSELNNDEILLIKPRFYINNGKNYATPDFAIYNTKTNQFVRIPDAKNGNAGLTPNQTILNNEGGEFRGSSRYPQAKPQSISPGMVTVEKTTVPYHN